MYKLSEALRNDIGIDCEPDCDIYCIESNPQTTLKTNRMTDVLDCYTFTIVSQGWLTLSHNGSEMTFRQGDIYLYTPGTNCTVVSCSADYRSFILMADASLTLSSPIVQLMIRTSYFSSLAMSRSKLTLQPDDFHHLVSIIRTAIHYQQRPHRFRHDAMSTLYTLFLLDLMDIEERDARHTHYSAHTEQLFTNFLQLAHAHFREHRDLQYYAEQLNITTVYLSRIVKRITGQTVIDYLNQLLLMEAVYLLRQTDRPIAAIAEQLHFADQASFSKFFSRLRGVSPKQCRIRKS